MSSKRYPDEFKVEAVKQVAGYGHSVEVVVSSLGVATHSLYAWIKKFDPDSADNVTATAVACRVSESLPGTTGKSSCRSGAIQIFRT